MKNTENFRSYRKMMGWGKGKQCLLICYCIKLECPADKPLQMPLEDNRYRFQYHFKCFRNLLHTGYKWLRSIVLICYSHRNVYYVETIQKVPEYACFTQWGNPLFRLKPIWKLLLLATGAENEKKNKRKISLSPQYESVQIKKRKMASGKEKQKEKYFNDIPSK